MNKKEFITKLAMETGRSQIETQKMMQTVVKAMGERFSDGESVLVSGFGSFEVKKRMERIMVNPSTGLRMIVPPKLVLGFRPTATVKEKLKKGGDA